MGYKDYIKAAWGPVGAFAILAFGKGFAHAYFWDVVLNSTRDELSPLVAYFTDFFPSVVILVLSYLLLDARLKRALVKKAKSLNIPVTIAVLLAAAFVADMGFIYWNAYVRDPIDWDLTDIVGFYSDGTPGLVYVDGFHFNGVTRTNVALDKASVVSKSKPNLSVELLAGADGKMGAVSDLNEIPKGVKFGFYADPRPLGQKMTSTQFLLDWGEFALVTVSNGKRYEYILDKEAVDKVVHTRELASRPENAPNLSWKQH